MKRISVTSFIIICNFYLASSQDLNWNTSGYATGALTHNFGSNGSPASTVNMTISGNTGTINGGFPVLYIADWPMAGSCAVNCAQRTSVTFTTIAQTIVYTFSFSPAVSPLSFTVYDIDGNGGGTTIDQLTVTAANGATAQNITMTDIDGLTTVVGSGGTSPVATAIFGGSTDNRVNVAIGGFVSSLAIIYGSGPTTTAFGAKSFSIGNMDWTGVLPVRWISFSGRLQNNAVVELKWVTANELNADRYIVERSKDGQTYTAIGEVAAINNAGGIYLFTDNNPGAGNSFYRIRQADIDNRYDFSNIILIRKNGIKSPGIVLSPNPASQYLLISSLNNVQFKNLQIYNTNGQMVHHSVNMSNRIDISALKPGLYCVRVENNTGDIYTESFLKN